LQLWPELTTVRLYPPGGTLDERLSTSGRAIYLVSTTS
jgi:hypothetical protein